MSYPNTTRADRRKFLKGLAAGATGGAAVAALPVLPHASLTPPADAGTAIQYGMLIDLRKCVGCQSCSIACKAEFDVPLGNTRSWVEYVEKGSYPNVGRSFLPRLCNHCSEPQCVAVCPTGATYKRKEDGIVVVDTGVCIGCKYCVQIRRQMRFLCAPGFAGAGSVMREYLPFRRTHVRRCERSEQ
jgi:tetrathionate reductase subunit B